MELGGSFWNLSAICTATPQPRSNLLTDSYEVIDILVGTEQGHPMSPEMFKVYIHELSELLEAAGVDVPMLNDVLVSHLLWADDLILMALDQHGLQKLLDCLYDFCTSWGLSVNPDKTKIMIFNRSGKSYHNPANYCTERQTKT